MKTGKFNYYIAGVIALIMAFSSCTKDLDTIPLDPDEVTSAAVYTKDLSNYTMVLAKLYAGLSVTGQEGPAGMGDIGGLDEGFSQYLRLYWYAQELSTDEAIIAWDDGNLRDFHDLNWTSSNEFLSALYYRIYYQVSITNEFLRETTPEKLEERGMAEADRVVVNTYRAEARFLRALSYYHALDLFGSVPFVTEEDQVGSFFPEQISRADLYSYVESELIAIENDLMAPRSVYARADKGAVWMLLAKLYLNAEVYTDQDKYTECITMCKNIIDAGYTLEPQFAKLFMADNHTASGTIFPITFDGTYTRTYGGTTFLIHAAVGGTMAPGDFGIDGGWAGTRVTRSLVEKFIDPSLLKSMNAMNSRVKGSKAYPMLYVTGDHDGWAHSPDYTLASVNSDDNYEGYIWLNDGEGFKIDPSSDWAETDHGDNEPDGILDNPGDNIPVDGDGYYKINVNWDTKAYTMVSTSWAIIGDASPGGWDSETEMEYDPATGEWFIVTNLSAGKIKFRANNDWEINLGDNGADGILEPGGADIDVIEPGKYELRLKLGTPDYTFSMVKAISDDRIMFHSDGQSLDISEVYEFTEGWAVTKFTNLTSGGVAGSHLEFTDTDFPLFRIADVYLMYAEAVLRGGTGGDLTYALELVNRIIARGYGGDEGANIESQDLTLDFILDERARELLWETHRRTDLVRFGKLTTPDYIWAWKGGVPEGRAVDNKYNIYPLPASDIAANPNLNQVYY